MVKRILIMFSVVLMLFSTTIANVSANTSPDFQLTVDEEKQVEAMIEEWDRYEKITSNLSQTEIDILFKATRDSNSNKLNNHNLMKEIVIVDNKRDVDILNDQLSYVGEPTLPEGTVSVSLKDEEMFVATTEKGEEIIMPFGFWGKAWQVTKCVAHLTLVVVPFGAAARAIKGLGGIKKTAQLLVGAGSKKEFEKIAMGAAAEILGISGIADNCFGWN